MHELRENENVYYKDIGVENSKIEQILLKRKDIYYGFQECTRKPFCMKSYLKKLEWLQYSNFYYISFKTVTLSGKV